MTLQPIKDVSEYKRLKQSLRDRFEPEKTGDQSLFRGSRLKNINRCYHLRVKFQKPCKMLQIKQLRVRTKDKLHYCISVKAMPRSVEGGSSRSPSWG